MSIFNLNYYLPHRIIFSQFLVYWYFCIKSLALRNVHSRIFKFYRSPNNHLKGVGWRVTKRFTKHGVHVKTSVTVQSVPKLERRGPSKGSREDLTVSSPMWDFVKTKKLDWLLFRAIQFAFYYVNRDLKIPWTRRLRERRKPGARTPPPPREKQIKIEQVGLSARLTREDKVMLSCFNSMTSFRKTREVFLDWYLNDLLLEEKFVLQGYDSSFSKK